jgi:hypothetical protein
MATRRTSRTSARAARVKRGRLTRVADTLLLGTRQLRRDPEFTWASGGRPYVERSAGNGQRPNDGTWGLWYSPVRPIRTGLRPRPRVP